MSFAWDSSANSAGYTGHAYSTSLAPGQGQHGSMSPHETRNVLLASGPAFKQSARITTPTGNVDIAPTVLHLLGLPGADSMQGRILHETLRNGPETVPWNTITHEAKAETPNGICHQEISISHVGGALYVNRGTARANRC